MRFQSLASSSTGNAYIVDDGCTSILIECGLTHKKLQQLCGFKTTALDGCLVSHEHKDHKPNSHPVRDLQEYTVNGVTYKVDGRNVQLDYKPYEKEIAELLRKEVGGEIYMVPRVNNPQGISTPDYIFNGKAYDLKTLSKEATENTIFNRVKKARKQAHNFIVDVSASSLNDEVIETQIKKIFENKSTTFVDEIVIIKNGTIKKVVKRKKS